ncbi:hypothetical protein D2Q93_04370 [Alicyclobacillaceae bacterium I2511]|nr:hypothetical protein D2Q93_04370 [Alicyclobacillaceae bacterium I2511]
MLKEIDPRTLSRPTQQLDIKLIRLNTNTDFDSNARASLESNTASNVLVCMLLNNPVGPVRFLFEQPMADLTSIYKDVRCSVLCTLCLEVFAIQSNNSFIGMQMQNIQADRIDNAVKDSLKQDILSLFSPTEKTEFVAPKAGSIRAFLVQKNSPSASSTFWSGEQFLVNQCKLSGGILGIPLLGKSINEIDSNSALTALSETVSKVIILGGSTNGEEWQSTHLILETQQ